MGYRIAAGSVCGALLIFVLDRISKLVNPSFVLLPGAIGGYFFAAVYLVFYVGLFCFVWQTFRRYAAPVAGTNARESGVNWIFELVGVVVASFLSLVFVLAVATAISENKIERGMWIWTGFVVASGFLVSNAMKTRLRVAGIMSLGPSVVFLVFGVLICVVAFVAGSPANIPGFGRVESDSDRYRFATVIAAIGAITWFAITISCCIWSRAWRWFALKSRLPADRFESLGHTFYLIVGLTISVCAFLLGNGSSR